MAEDSSLGVGQRQDQESTISWGGGGEYSERGALEEKPGGTTFPRGQSWTLGQSRLQRERPEAGTGPESQGWLGSRG